MRVSLRPKEEQHHRTNNSKSTGSARETLSSRRSRVRVENNTSPLNYTYGSKLDNLFGYTG